MRIVITLIIGLVILPCLSQAIASDAASGLRPVESFSQINNQTARSRALFKEAGKVIQHPRCLNCHVPGDSPRQGMAMTVHEPPVTRGANGFGAPGMRCNTCHQSRNVEASGVPGDPDWHLAPKSMTWYGRSLADICRQIKDPKRNGGRGLSELVDHMAHNHLVGWGWRPGDDRKPAPGTQQAFGKLIAAWVDTGAACPTS